MIYVFPRMTKCTFHKFGTSGNIEKHDALCILPLNIVNEKVKIKPFSSGGFKNYGLEAALHSVFLMPKHEVNP